ncbi:MAG TPA: NADP-dependent phosphogluconate dehydrogenase [Chitinophagaceae bacterium]|jgi:6-phosphogluconate dehydrogenase|nr:NADP-dependent phosphogluconate dehydrogenase [Chitinophagaceae bacterium]
MQAQFDFGMVGLGVMGSNLLLNLADHGFAVIGHDLKAERCKALEDAASEGTTVKGVTDLKLMVSALKQPRKIMMLVPAGSPVDAVINSLKPFVEDGDILVDAGNSFYSDTLRRVQELKEHRIHFFGMGISGGEFGARLGPSMMPGGDREAYEHLKPLLEAVAAKADGVPCVAYMGTGAAGHYVKMVHNGIEYAMMQAIAEVYALLSTGAGLDNEALHATFLRWNKGQLQSFLIHITATIFNTRDEDSNEFLVDVILDQAGSKGTGKWTSQEALNLPVPIPTIDAAVAARTLSGLKAERAKAAELYKHAPSRIAVSEDELLNKVENALAFCFVVAYAQGLNMIARASDELGMDIPLPSVIQVWKAGCIIRSALLGRFSSAYQRNGKLTNLLLDAEIAELLKEKEDDFRSVVAIAVQAKISMPCMMSALAYFDSYCTERMPTNLIQAQRDYFGAHTYERVDRAGVFHTEWHSGM